MIGGGEIHVWHNVVLWWKDAPVSFIITCVDVVFLTGVFVWLMGSLYNSAVEELTEEILENVAPWRKW